jgi:putative membrane protein
MRFVVLVLKGMLYGVTHVSPGLGGGIVLILLGIYGEFVEAIGNLFVKRDRWRQYLGFLVPLGIGMIVGILAAAALIERLLTRYPTLTMFVFMGLLVGTIPSVLRLHDDLRPTPRRIAALILGAALVIGIRVLEAVLVGRDVTYTFTNAREVAYQSLISFLAGCASVTPGLDGSTVLLLGGTYACGCVRTAQPGYSLGGPALHGRVRRSWRRAVLQSDRLGAQAGSGRHLLWHSGTGPRIDLWSLVADHSR